MSHTGYIAYIGTNSTRNSRGIYTVHIDGETGRAEIRSTHPAYHTGALALSGDGRRLYAASEGMSFQGYASGGMMAFEAGADGALRYLNGVPTWGQRPCCLALDDGGKRLYAANFYGGSLSAASLAEDGSLEPARLLAREPRPEGWLHGMHCVGVLDGGRQVGAISLSNSEFVIYSAEDGRRLAAYGFGHKVFARSFDSVGEYIYAMLQDPGDIYVLKNRAGVSGTVEKVQVISVLPPTHQGPFGTSAIRVTPNGQLLIAATRRTNTLSLFRIVPGDGTLTPCAVVKLPGLTPRDFMVSPDGRFLVTALQASDQLCVHEIDYEAGTLSLRDAAVHIPSPAAVVIWQEGRK